MEHTTPRRHVQRGWLLELGRGHEHVVEETKRHCGRVRDRAGTYVTTNLHGRGRARVHVQRPTVQACLVT